MKAIKQVLRQDRESYRIPRRVQDVIPIRRIWSDGIFLVGNRYAKTFKFTDINYMVASQESQKNLFLTYAALINSLDCSATTKITLNNHHLNRKNFESTVLMQLRGDTLDGYRQEYNDVIMEKGTGGSGIVQEKYVTVSVCKKSIEDARAYFTRAGAELTARFSALGARVTELDATEKLRLLHDFYRSDEEVYFHFDMQDMMRRLNQSGKRLSKGHRKIAEYIVEHYDKAVFMTASKLGEKVGVSESTVVRFASAMGYEGYPQLQRALHVRGKKRLCAKLIGIVDRYQFDPSVAFLHIFGKHRSHRSNTRLRQVEYFRKLFGCHRAAGCKKHSLQRCLQCGIIHLFSLISCKYSSFLSFNSFIASIAVVLLSTISVLA